MVHSGSALQRAAEWSWRNVKYLDATPLFPLKGLQTAEIFAPPSGCASSNPSKPRVGATARAHLDTAPVEKGNGVAMSSSPCERLWNGDEDVATPFHAGAVSRCDPRQALVKVRVDCHSVL